MSQSKDLSINNQPLTLLFSESEIEQRVKALAKEVQENFEEDSPLLIGVLNGSFMFINSLVKAYNDYNIEISFVKYSSYVGTESSGKVTELIGFGENIKGKSVLIVEDIVDTGLTLKSLLKEVQKFEPKSVQVVTLLLKEVGLKEDVQVDYYGFKVPDLFVVGYGMDYNGKFRNIPAIYYLENT